MRDVNIAIADHHVGHHRDNFASNEGQGGHHANHYSDIMHVFI